MKFGDSHKIASAQCPECKRQLNGATEVSAEGGSHMPEPGSVTICLYCGTQLEFTKTLGLVRLTPKAKKQLDITARDTLDRLRRAILQRQNQN